MCLYPTLIKNRKYIANEKNGGIIPPIKDIRTTYVPIGCQRCIECKKQKARAWSVRLQEEIRHDDRGKFVTLSFSDESLEELYKDCIPKMEKKKREEIFSFESYEASNEIATLGVRRFLERWRKENKKSVKHWLVTELGQQNTERIHIHGIIFWDKTEDIEKHWKYGNVYIGEYTTEKTVNYIVKYISEPDELHPTFQPKTLCSKGIGSQYLQRRDSTLNRYKPEKTKETYTTRDGQKLNLPIYYRNKIYTEEEKEALWIQKLDKNERYVLGEKISLNGDNGEKNYYLALENAQRVNNELKYGNNEIDWDKKAYETERRKLIWKEAIEKLKESL
jgi:hypothetical protein